jgi:hypothetical protein
VVSQLSEDAYVTMNYANIPSFTVSRCSSSLYEFRPKEAPYKYKGATESIMADICDRFCCVFSWNEAAVLE